MRDRDVGDQIGSYDPEWINRIKAFETTSPRPFAEMPESLLYPEIGEIWQPIAESDDWTAFEQKIVNINEMT